MENDAAYGRPDLEMAPEVSEASLTMARRLGRRRVISFSGLRGSFYLRPTGEVAGFAFLLTIPQAASRRQYRNPGRRTRSLSWEAVDVSYSDRNNFSSEGRLRLNGQEVWATAYGQIAQIPSHGSPRPYLRVMLATDFRAFVLGWPRPTTRPLKPVRLRLFTEIHPRRRR